MMRHLFSSVLMLGSVLSAQTNEVYEKKCASCHAYFVPVSALMGNFMQHKNQVLKLKGPTVNQLNFRLRQMIGDPKGDAEFYRMEVVEFIRDYVLYPDKQKSVCLPEIIEQFEVMPSMQEMMTDEEIESVANWIFDYTPPKETK